MRRAVPFVCAVLLSLAASPAGAEPTAADRNAARALADKGADLFESGKYEKAIEQFRQAEALVHAAPHLLYMARANEKLGKLVEAHEIYEDIVTDLITRSSPAAFREAQETARTEQAALIRRIPTVKLTVTSPDMQIVQVTIDSKAVRPELWQEPILLNPGTHTIKATGRGLRSESAVVSVSEQDKINVSLSLRWEGSLIPAIVVGGVGVVGLGIGIVTGAMSLSRVGDLEARCPEAHCLPKDEPIGDSAKSLGTASTIGFVAGTALIGAGVALAIIRPWGGPPAPTDPEEKLFPESVSVRARIGPGSIALEGTF